jgi:hypothetical protein
MRPPNRWHRLWAMTALLCLLASAQAQMLRDLPTDWKETEVPAPPAFSLDRLQPFEVSVRSELRYGIDPATVTLGEDGVVRYVMVATSPSGALNARYEGVRCASGEVKTYAHWNPSPPGSWQAADQAQWRSLLEGHATRPALMLARAAWCEGATPNGNVARMLRDLRLGRPQQP